MCFRSMSVYFHTDMETKLNPVVNLWLPVFTTTVIWGGSSGQGIRVSDLPRSVLRFFETGADIGTGPSVTKSGSEKIKEVILKIQKENLKAQGYYFRDGLIFYKGSIFLLRESGITLKVIKEFHDKYIGGHSV